MQEQKSVLVSGCSFTANASWPQQIFPGHDIVNLARFAAGNRYISHSVVSHCLRHRPDKVFILFSGINRFDLSLPLNDFTRDLGRQLRYIGIVDEIMYFFGGGDTVLSGDGASDKWTQQLIDNYIRIKDTAWPDIHSIDDFFGLPTAIREECMAQNLCYNGDTLYSLLENACMINYLTNNQASMSQHTYDHMLYVLNTLQNLDIDYHFGFIHNPFDQTFQRVLGNLDPEDVRYKHVRWDRFIPVFPFEIALRSPQYSDDGFHLNAHGQTVFAQQLLEHGLS